jgi:pyruvate-formate lyase-activating enzyme
MSVSGLRPEPDDEPDFGGRSQAALVGQFLTFVLPAAGGCNLKCPFCFVRQRREITETCLQPDDLVRFIREAAERAPIFALAIQGYEPLLPASLPYTQAVLATGRLLGLPTTLVTNGVLLADTLDLMAALRPSRMAISLDAAWEEVHDRIRGVTGAWAATVRGIRSAVEILSPRTKLAVSSVLLPSKRYYLDDLPARLREIGIDNWIVNPLLRVGHDDLGGPVDDPTKLFHDLLVLQASADRAGIRLTVDDEFNHLAHDTASISQPELRSIHVRTLPSNVEIFRLTPGAQCSIGEGILKQVTPEARRWRPGVVHASDFLEMLSEPTTSGFRRTA